MKKKQQPSDSLLLTAFLNPRSMHHVFSLSSNLRQVICVILFCQCDFTQLWGNQPTKIGRKALCIRIKINKIKSNTYIESNF